MQTFMKVCNLISDISYKDWTFKVGNMDKGWFVQCRFMAPDADTGCDEVQAGRKWYISPHMTDSEIVQTVFSAVKMAETHELHENFRYKGVQPFNPHLDLNHLVSLNLPHDARQHISLTEEPEVA